jgi:hypothetical protein
MANTGQEETAIISWRECSKKSVQQGRSPFDARSVHGVREHGKMARTPLAAFFNIPLIMQVEAAMPHGIPLGSYPSHCPTPAGPKPGIYPIFKSFQLVELWSRTQRKLFGKNIVANRRRGSGGAWTTIEGRHKKRRAKVIW